MASLLESLTENVSWLTLVLAGAVCIVLYVYIQWSSSSSGPVGLPYLGYYPFLNEQFHVQLAELAKKYGEVYCFRITGQLYVHLNSLRAIKEAHITKSECFGARTSNYCILKDLFDYGVGFVNGEPWKVLKKFFLQTLKELGMGKVGQETAIVDRIQNVIDVLKQSKGKGVDILQLSTDNSSQVIQQLLFSGGRIGDEDSERLIVAFKKIMSFVKGPSILLAGPLAKHLIFPFMKGFKECMETKVEMETIFCKIIKEHENTFDKDHLRDLVDYYIDERRNLREKGDPKAEIYTDKALAYTLIQFFGDGSLSIGLFIAEVFKEVAKHPDVQKRIQSEIDEVVGRERLPTSADRSRMQYTSATLNEVARISDFFPVFPSQVCTKETVILGQRIPVGAITLLNTWSVHHNPQLYEEPDKFDPSRFLPTEDRKTKAELPISFGVGKRSCIGESLTNMEVFLFVAAILQHFDIHPAEKESTPGVEEVEDWEIRIRATLRAD